MSEAAVDNDTATRIRGEWEKVKAAVQGQSESAINDPLGQDGVVSVVANSFRATGAGDVTFLKGDAGADRRYTRFRTWGPTGSENVEKTSLLISASGAKEFHKRRVEAGELVTVFDGMEEEDEAWAGTLA